MPLAWTGHPGVPEVEAPEFTMKLKIIFVEEHEKSVAVLGRIVFYAYERGNHSAGQAPPIIALKLEI
jgi:hypothetical protein